MLEINKLPYIVFMQLTLLKSDFRAIVISNHIHDSVVFKIQFSFFIVLKQLVV